ncbi:C-GCAxxG-C-C family protein [Bacteroidota bacterium]
MNKITEAVEYFNRGYNCCQSILLTYGKEFGIDKKTSIKIGHAFGGGIVRTGETCGAVAGAIMIIGLKYGKTKLVDKESDKRVFHYTTKFLKEFEAENKSSLCIELLNIDISTKEGLEKAENEGIFKATCPKIVESAARILKNIITD